MPQLEITDSDLIVHLDKWEGVFAFIHEVKVPLRQIVSVRENNGLEGVKLGWRVPGTHIPFLLAAGTFISHGARQFVYRRGGLQTVVIDLHGNEWARLIIGVPEAKRETSRINAAVSTCISPRPDHESSAKTGLPLAQPGLHRHRLQ